MKKHLIISSGALLAALSVGAGIEGIRAQTFATKAEGEKEVISFNITTFSAMNPPNGVVLFNTDKTMPSFASGYSFNWMVDGKTKQTYVYKDNLGNGGQNNVYFAWEGTYPADGDAGYHHWHLEAGTIIYEDASSKYVLEKDYNFWYARHSGGGDFSDWVWQHGQGSAVSDVGSFSLSDSYENGVQAGEGRWLTRAEFVKSSGWSSLDLGNGNAFYYAMNGSSTYELGYNGDASDHYFVLFGDLATADVTTGSEYLLPYFRGFDTTSGADKEISFFFPKGTLFGGLNEGYRCFLENDYYITILKDYVVGTTASSQSLFYEPVTSFVDGYMHMSDADYEGEGTGLCTSGGTYASAKTAYSSLSSIQKYFFLNSGLYTDAAARLNAWASANGDVIDPTTREFKKASAFTLPSENNSVDQTALIVVISVACFATAAALAFALKKKRQN